MKNENEKQFMLAIICVTALLILDSPPLTRETHSRCFLGMPWNVYTKINLYSQTLGLLDIVQWTYSSRKYTH